MEREGSFDPIADLAARLRGISPQDLVMAMVAVSHRFGDVELVKNHVGNLAVMRGDDYLGYVDLRTGHLEVFERVHRYKLALKLIDERRPDAAAVIRSAEHSGVPPV